MVLADKHRNERDGELDPPSLVAQSVGVSFGSPSLIAGKFTSQIFFVHASIANGIRDINLANFPEINGLRSRSLFFRTFSQVLVLRKIG